MTKPHTLEDRTRCRRCLSGPSPGDRRTGPNTQAGLEGSNDARTGMPPGIPEGAMCVQRLDDSLNSAIHITYRISLRSSSMPEPRDPLLKVLIHFSCFTQKIIQKQEFIGAVGRSAPNFQKEFRDFIRSQPMPRQRLSIVHKGFLGSAREGVCSSNDPSAGSPTETLLRLLLPLNDRVWITFRP